MTTLAFTMGKGMCVRDLHAAKDSGDGDEDREEDEDAAFLCGLLPRGPCTEMEGSSLGLFRLWGSKNISPTADDQESVQAGRQWRGDEITTTTTATTTANRNNQLSRKR